MDNFRDALTSVFTTIIVYAVMLTLLFASLGALFWAFKFFIKQFFGVSL